MKTIIEMAREAGLWVDGFPTQHIEQFSAKVKAARDAELLEGVEMPEPVGVVQYHPSGRTRIVPTGAVTDCDASWQVQKSLVTLDQLRETVAAAVLREREACAKVCEETHDLFVTSKPSRANAGDCAAAIRNRSNA